MSNRHLFFLAFFLCIAFTCIIIIYTTQEGGLLPVGWRRFAGFDFQQQAPLNMQKKICRQNGSKAFARMVTALRQCLTDALTDNAWRDIVEVIELCVGETLLQALEIRKLQNKDDTKYVILPTDEGVPMVQVTLGIGKDIESEKQLRALLPHCRFYGADPSSESGRIFNELGKHFRYAVAAEAGMLEANVLENDGYHRKVVETISFADFLLNYAKTNKVDFLFLDTEGGEYKIFPQLMNSELLEQRGITICQITVEMHAPLDQHGMDETKFHALMVSTLENSPYIPLYAVNADDIRLFLVNVVDPYCVETFFANRFCEE